MKMLFTLPKMEEGFLASLGMTAGCMPLSKKKVRWPRMSYDSFRRVRQIFATAAITFAIVVIWRFAHAAPVSLKTTRNGVAILFWTLGPPVWFFL